jgi:hypothetical protein
MTAERLGATYKIDPLIHGHLLLFVCKVAARDILEPYFMLMYAWLKWSRYRYKMKRTCSKCFKC